MTMHFRTIKDAIETLLVNAASGQYRVRGYPDQAFNAAEFADTDRLVQVYYDGGNFPNTSSGRGPYDHRMTFKIQLIASRAAQCDLTVLNDLSATQGQLAAALAAVEPAAKGVDDSIDELIDLVFNVLMDGDNLHLGLSDPVGSRWIERIEKQEPYARGDRAVAEATMDLTCRRTEEVPTTDLLGTVDVIKTDIQNQGDTAARASVEVETT